MNPYYVSPNQVDLTCYLFGFFVLLKFWLGSLNSVTSPHETANIFHSFGALNQSPSGEGSRIDQ